MRNDLRQRWDLQPYRRNVRYDQSNVGNVRADTALAEKKMSYYSA